MAQRNTLTAIVLALPLLLPSSLLAGERNDTARKHEFRAWVGVDMTTPLQISETNGPTLRRKFSQGYEAGLGYGHKLYKNLSAVVAVGAHAYSYRYATDVVLDGPRLIGHHIPIRRTERFLCWQASLSLQQKFILAETPFSAEGGVRLLNIPSLLLGHGRGIQDTTGITRRFFNAEVEFTGYIQPVYFLKFGMPLYKNKLSAHVVFNYCPTPLGTGHFYIINTTQNSSGTFEISGSGMGVELRYSF